MQTLSSDVLSQVTAGNRMLARSICKEIKRKLDSYPGVKLFLSKYGQEVWSSLKSGEKSPIPNFISCFDNFEFNATKTFFDVNCLQDIFSPVISRGSKIKRLALRISRQDLHKITAIIHQNHTVSERISCLELFFSCSPPFLESVISEIRQISLTLKGKIVLNLSSDLGCSRQEYVAQDIKSLSEYAFIRDFDSGYFSSPLLRSL